MHVAARGFLLVPLAVWMESDNNGHSIWSNRYTAGTRGTATTIETDTGDAIDSVQIAVDASGNALALWLKHEAMHSSIMSARFE